MEMAVSILVIEPPWQVLGVQPARWCTTEDEARRHLRQSFPWTLASHPYFIAARASASSPSLCFGKSCDRPRDHANPRVCRIQLCVRRLGVQSARQVRQCALTVQHSGYRDDGYVYR
jgi:hypothetical protein